MDFLKNSYKTVSKGAYHFFSGTLLSRITGMLRDVSMAMAFGDHPSVAAFMVAFRFSHFFRRLLGEGPLQLIFIPHYEELKLQNSKKADAFFFRLTLLLILLLLLIIFFFEGLIGITPFFKGEVGKLFAYMLPSLFFISLYGLNISLLQCHHSFFSSSAAPVACNIVWILGAFLLSNYRPMDAMPFLALFIVLGFIIQWLITLPKTWKHFFNGKAALEGSFFSIPKEVKNLGKAAFFGILGIMAVQLNSFIDMLFARFADLKGPIYLWYAIRLEQLPFALIGLSCVYSIAPTLTRLIKSGEDQKTKELFAFGYKRILFFMIPCMFAVFSLGYTSVNLLFGRGHFPPEAVMKTTHCLWAYALSLLPSTLIMYQSSIFYAYGDFRIPTIASLLSVVVNLVLNALFIFILHQGIISIAISTSLSAWINYFFLKGIFLKRHDWRLFYLKRFHLGKLYFIGLIPLLCTLALGNGYNLRDLSMQLKHFSMHFSCFFLVFLLSVRVFYKEMFSFLINFIKT